MWFRMSPPTTLRPEAAHGRKSSPKPLKFIYKTAISGRAPKPRRIQDRNGEIFSENSKMTHFFDQKVCPNDENRENSKKSDRIPCMADQRKYFQFGARLVKKIIFSTVLGCSKIHFQFRAWPIREIYFQLRAWLVN